MYITCHIITYYILHITYYILHIIESSNTPYIFAMGDYNANIKSESVFGSELIEFCDLNNLCFIDKFSLSPDSYTFISQAHHTTS